MCIRIVDFERKQTQSLIKKSIQEITRINNRIKFIVILYKRAVHSESSDRNIISILV
jgi:hypothetical protein